jgi:uncharacterized protein with FMN-binding domain
MKKILLSLGVVLAFAFYAILANRSDVSQVAANPAIVPTPTSSSPTPEAIPTPSTTSVSAPIALASGSPNPTPIPITRPAGPTGTGYKDGSYTGPVTDAFYGSVQVKAVVQNGALADVKFLQSPGGTGTTIRINTSAMPQLTQEAITAQSANVNIISGATQTSEAFQQSLAGALAMAK